VRQRGPVLAIFFCAIPVGSALGYVVGGLFDKHTSGVRHFSWPASPAWLLAACCFAAADPPARHPDQAACIGKAETTTALQQSGARETWKTYLLNINY